MGLSRLSENSGEAFNRGLTGEMHVSGSNQVWARGFFRVDSHDTSMEVCFIQIYTRESGRDSVGALYVPKVCDIGFIFKSRCGATATK